jgi:Alpha-glutamyl/putrescinyl thymine pyrophosphorylase clade 3
MDHSANTRQLRGVKDPQALETLSTQIVASLRREDYYKLVQLKRISARRADPNDDAFDAERAVAYHIQQDNLDEAAWLTFLMTYFAKPDGAGWLRLRDVYGKLGNGIWDWQSVSADPQKFAMWLKDNWRQVRGKFGNHRKYESLRPDSPRNMGRVVDDYVRWIGRKGHRPFFEELMARGSNDPFDALYNEMAVTSFGRLAKFDYLLLLGRYGIANVVPSCAYLDGATGPLAGARLLFTGSPGTNTPVAALQQMLDDLDADVHVGMAVLEDALCNWQKEPLKFVHFQG